MFELIINKRLRDNYCKILKFQTAGEIENFLSALNEKEKNELFAYTYGYAVKERRRNGIPITEYFLLHYDEFIPNVKKDVFNRTDKFLNIILGITIVIIVVMLF